MIGDHVSVEPERAPRPWLCFKSEPGIDGLFHTNILSADLDRPYPPAVARRHAATDKIAAIIIVIRIVVVIGVGPKTKSHETTPMKSAGEATMESTAVEAASAKPATMEAAASKATAVTAATAAAVTTTATAARKCRRRLNQADSRQCEQSHHPFAYHACLHDLKSPTKHETLWRLEYSAAKKSEE
jgi:hypothetical protein